MGKGGICREPMGKGGGGGKLQRTNGEVAQNILKYIYSLEFLKSDELFEIGKNSEAVRSNQPNNRTRPDQSLRSLGERN